jgi:methylated-DNA-[protein]-cysteine S-methyltransferase
MYNYTIFKTSLGFMGAVASEKGLHMIILPRPSEAEIRTVLTEHYSVELARNERKLAGFAKKIKSYLAGKKVPFKETLDISGATPFEMRVWDTVYGIPYGEVRSYAWVAQQIGNPKEVQAVGQALKRNRLPIIIPCHRVISKSGDLGGFSGGVELKRKLLKIEGRVW